MLRTTLSSSPNREALTEKAHQGLWPVENGFVHIPAQAFSSIWAVRLSSGAIEWMQPRKLWIGREQIPRHIGYSIILRKSKKCSILTAQAPAHPRRGGVQDATA